MIDNAKKVKIISIITVCLAFILLIVLIFQFAKLNTLKKREAELTKTLSSLEEVISDYNKEKNYYEDREKYLDEYAHIVLNMTKDGETWYETSKN